MLEILLIETTKRSILAMSSSPILSQAVSALLRTMQQSPCLPAIPLPHHTAVGVMDFCRRSAPVTSLKPPDSSP